MFPCRYSLPTFLRKCRRFSESWIQIKINQEIWKIGKSITILWQELKFNNQYRDVTGSKESTDVKLNTSRKCWHVESKVVVDFGESGQERAGETWSRSIPLVDSIITGPVVTEQTFMPYVILPFQRHIWSASCGLSPSLRIWRWTSPRPWPEGLTVYSTRQMHESDLILQKRPSGDAWASLCIMVQTRSLLLQPLVSFSIMIITTSISGALQFLCIIFSQ